MKKGDTYACSFVIDLNVYNGFISIFKDTNPLHTDKSFAVSKGFDDKVMHGNILNGFVSYFIGECLPLKNVMILSQEIKYNKPVYLNDNLLFNAEIEDVFDSVNLISISYNFKNQNNVKVASGKIKIGLL